MESLEFLREEPIAHRGYWNKKEGIPENSIPAFEKAIEKKYPIELDVHLSKDNKLFVFHDDNLKRMTGIDKNIRDCTYDEINGFRLDNTEYKIPLFSDVLDLINGRVPILIELKADRKVGETEKELVNLLKKYNGKYAIQSFRIRSLIWFKKNHPSIIRGQLSADFKKNKMLRIQKFILRNVYLNFLVNPDFIAYAINSLPNKRIEKLHKNGMPIIGWTVKNNMGLEKAKGKCDNLICENFEELDLNIFYK